MIVVDASVAIKWLVREKGHEQALAACEGEVLVAPDRPLLEVANVLRRKMKQGEIGFDHAKPAVELVPGLIDTVVPSADLLEDAFLIADRLDHSVYDCAYLACARHIDALLLTADQRFFNKARQVGVGDRVKPCRQAVKRCSWFNSLCRKIPA